MHSKRTIFLSNFRFFDADFQQGILDGCPLLLGIVPFGITCGIIGLTAGLTPTETLFMSLLVFAGAAQFIAITMLGTGLAGIGLITLTTLLVNARHMLMGASLAPYMINQTRPQQLLLSFLMTDESYAVTISHTCRHSYSSSYQLGVSLCFYIIWNLSTLTGILVGSYIPDPLSWGLDFAMPATFLVLLLPRLKDFVSIAVSITAAILAVIGAVYLPGKLYMIAACLGSIFIASLLEGAKKYAK